MSQKIPKDEMKLINKYTRRNYSDDDVYTFSVTLCDNEIDKDFERFTDTALEKLSEMFVGKTGITSHEPEAENQLARIYFCCVEKVHDKKNSLGEDYKRLSAKAYIPICEKSKSLIENINRGIKKEVSIACTVTKTICSVCGRNINDSSCGHIKGKYYGSKFCHVLLDEPCDVYEWAFIHKPKKGE